MQDKQAAAKNWIQRHKVSLAHTRSGLVERNFRVFDPILEECLGPGATLDSLLRKKEF